MGHLTRQRAEAILDEVAEGILRTRGKVSEYLSDHDEFSVGEAMLAEWKAGGVRSGESNTA